APGREGDRHARPQELTAEPGLARELPPGALRRRLAPLLGPRRLLPRVEVERAYEGLGLLDRRRKTVAGAEIERARVRPPSRRLFADLPWRLVARGVKGFDRDLARLLARLEDRGLRRDDRSLLDLAYDACDVVPGGYRPAVEVPLAPDASAHLAMRRIHTHLLGVIRANEPGLRAGLDIEFLHDFRVAVRRTRSALGQVRGVFPERRERRFRREFAWLGRQTGALRDLDVYLLNLDGYRAALPPETAEALEPLEALRERRPRREHARLARLRDGARSRRLLDDWERLLADEKPPGLPPSAARPVAEVARERILAAHARVVRKGRKIESATPDEKLHRLRIDAKKLRYLLEFFRGLYPPAEIGWVIRALKDLQENLGDFNDLSVQQRELAGFGDELAAEGAAASAVMALGRLVAVLAGRQAETRQDFHRRFARFDRPGVERRLTALLQGAAP
ncbi:MAG: CHAD domain-containing protein, partial [Thermoanaerobaculia bacterium]|nr:CHAD domain-containing protein [Thermoanaerobaculia bacterium]